MQFGQLQIFRPDGPVETILLEGDSIGIGRAPGNFLVLDRNGVSRYHVTISVKDGEAYLEDLESVNGTYIDGLPLAAHEPRLLRGGEEIQIADVRLVYQPVVDLDVTVRSATQTLEFGGYSIELEGPEMAVTPGAHSAAQLCISNMTDETQSFTVSVEGLPDDWARLDHRELDVPGNDKRDIRISFKPRRHPDSKPGEYNFNINVEADGEVHSIASRLHVLKYSGYGVALAHPTIQGHQPFQMFVHNQGNAPLSLDFRGESPGNKLRFQIAPTSLILSAGERQTVSGRIEPIDRPLVGNDQAVRFDIISRARDASGFQAPISGKYVMGPAIPRWGLIAGGIASLLGVGLAILLVFGVLLGSDNDDPETTDVVDVSAPTIAQFDLNASETTIDQPVLISWDIENSELASVVVVRDEDKITTYALPNTVGVNFEIPIESAGRYTLRLEGKNGDQETVEERVIFVKPDLELNVNVPGNQDGSMVLYRNVEQVVEMSWDVNWTADPGQDTRPAPTVILDSPALGYVEQNVPLSSPAQQITIRPTTLDSITISLLSNGPDSVQNELEQEILVVEPVCTVFEDNTALYGGPDADTYEVLGRVQPGALQLDARIEDGTWVRVFVPANLNLERPLAWIEVEQLNCSINLDDLLVTDEIPQAPRSPQQTPSPAATGTIAPSPRPTQQISGG